MARSALVVLIPEAEPLVGELRLLHDRMAGRGVPAHVTVLHPFKPVVDDATASLVGAIAAGTPAFEATFAWVDRFPGGVLFLSPDPIERFRRLSRAFIAGFPEHPPYGGTHPDPHPHLTVASSATADVAELLEHALRPGLPVRTFVDRLTLLVEDEAAMWTVDRHWPLGPMR